MLLGDKLLFHYYPEGFAAVYGSIGQCTDQWSSSDQCSTVWYHIRLHKCTEADRILQVHTCCCCSGRSFLRPPQKPLRWGKTTVYPNPHLSHLNICFELFSGVLWLNTHSFSGFQCQIRTLVERELNWANLQQLEKTPFIFSSQQLYHTKQNDALRVSAFF